MTPPNHMEAPPPAPKRPTVHSRGIGASETLNIRLTAAQAAWLRSTANREAISIASVVRGMIDAERVEDEDPAVVEAAFQRFMVRIATEPDGEVTRQGDSMAEPGHPISTMTARNAMLTDEGWTLFVGGQYPPGGSRRGLTEAQAIAWCLKGVLP